MRFILFGFLLAASTMAWAEVIKIQGRVSIWKAPVCEASDSSCVPLPQPLGIDWDVNWHYDRPQSLGRFKVADQELNQGEWSVHLLQVWVGVAAPQKSYIVTQIELERAGQLITQCSRYDATDAFAFLPPGSCAGRLGDQLFGVSLRAPAESP